MQSNSEILTSLLNTVVKAEKKKTKPNQTKQLCQQNIRLMKPFGSDKRIVSSITKKI